MNKDDWKKKHGNLILYDLCVCVYVCINVCKFIIRQEIRKKKKRK